MVKEIRNGPFIIPVPNEPLVTHDGQHYKQICQIPVLRRDIEFPPLLYYVCFDHPPVNIAAGGETLETAQDRLRWQMVDLSQRYSAALQNPHPPLNARSAVEIIQQFISLL